MSKQNVEATIDGLLEGKDDGSPQKIIVGETRKQLAMAIRYGCTTHEFDRILRVFAMTVIFGKFTKSDFE